MFRSLFRPTSFASLFFGAMFWAVVKPIASKFFIATRLLTGFQYLRLGHISCALVSRLTRRRSAVGPFFPELTKLLFAFRRAAPLVPPGPKHSIAIRTTRRLTFFAPKAILREWHNDRRLRDRRNYRNCSSPSTFRIWRGISHYALIS